MQTHSPIERGEPLNLKAASSEAEIPQAADKVLDVDEKSEKADPHGKADAVDSTTLSATEAQVCRKTLQTHHLLRTTDCSHLLLTLTSHYCSTHCSLRYSLFTAHCSLLNLLPNSHYSPLSTHYLTTSLPTTHHATTLYYTYPHYLLLLLLLCC